MPGSRYRAARMASSEKKGSRSIAQIHECAMHALGALLFTDTPIAIPVRIIPATTRARMKRSCAIARFWAASNRQSNQIVRGER